MTELEPIHPKDAHELFIENQRSEDLSPKTVDARDRRIGYFTDFLLGEHPDDPPEQGTRVETLDELTGRHLLAYKNHVADDIARATLRTYLSDVRVFLNFCTRIDAVDEKLPEKVGVPVLESDDNRRETLLNAEKAQAMLDYYDQYEYASLRHVLVLLMWRLGCRMGGLHSLDVGDVDRENDRIAFVHRPDQGTRLKNGTDGERIVAVDEAVTCIVADYIDHRRPPKTDKYGRRPLFTTEGSEGRLSKDQLHRQLYYATTPCHYGQECPVGNDPSSCEWASGVQTAIECPESERSHDVRRGSITYYLREGAPLKVVSDRMDADEETLEEHYDRRDETTKTELRREYLEEL